MACAQYYLQFPMGPISSFPVSRVSVPFSFKSLPFMFERRNMVFAVSKIVKSLPALTKLICKVLGQCVES